MTVTRSTSTSGRSKPKFGSTASRPRPCSGSCPKPDRQFHEQERPAYTGLGARIEQLLRLAEEQATEVVQTARSQANEIKAVAKVDAAELRAGAENEATELGANARRETDEQRAATEREADSIRTTAGASRRADLRDRA